MIILMKVIQKLLVLLELIPLVWHYCVSEDEKKEIKTFLVDKKAYCKWVMYGANAV